MPQAYAVRVELPASGRAAMGAPKPRARVQLPEETLSVPLVLGKQLHKLLEAGSGQRSPESVRDALLSLDRARAGFTAPPQGLILWDVKY